MLRKMNNIRFASIRSQLYTLLLTSVTLLAILLSIHVLFDFTWLYREAIFAFILLYLFFGTIIAVYTGFKASSNMKQRVDYLSVLITHYANGNYASRVHFTEEDEITRVSHELNELGAKLESQVHFLQRLADEKTAYAKKAYHVATIEERQRLARELHDSVSQQLFALTMMAEASANQFDLNPAIAKEHLEEVIQAGHTAQKEMRALLLHLRPVYLSGESLPNGIKKLVAEIEQKSDLIFHMFIDEALVLAETIEENVFRIIQEAFANIIRHAHATEVKLEINKKESELFIHLRDNGKGFNISTETNQTMSYGLKTMRERAEELGGTFAIRSDKDSGTYIDIRIPC